MKNNIQARIDALDSERDKKIAKHKAAYQSAMQTTQRWYEREIVRLANETRKK